MDFTAISVCAHPDDPPVGILEELGHRGLAQHRGAGLADLLGEPFIELGADDGVAVRLLLVEIIGAIVNPGVRTLVHDPKALLDEMPFKRCIFSEIRDQLLQHIGIEDGALHVLRARILAALQLQHF
ncbi:hypothetical protein ACVWWG_001950 [Bradyrhizobium sp. LB7.2]